MTPHFFSRLHLLVSVLAFAALPACASAPGPQLHSVKAGSTSSQSRFSAPAALPPGGPEGPAATTATPTKLALSPPQPLGKDVIRRVVRRKLSRIRYCYEKELVSKPLLAGKVTTSFKILMDGSVTQVSTEGLGDVAVEACITMTVESLRFPESHAGSMTVRYPFTLISPNKPSEVSAE